MVSFQLHSWTLVCVCRHQHVTFISPTFSYLIINSALLCQFVANLLAQNQKMSEKTVFSKASSPEMTSQSFPISCFWSSGSVPHRKWNLTLLMHLNTGKENRYRKICFAILVSTLWEFYRANKKNSVIYTLITGKQTTFTCFQTVLKMLADTVPLNFLVQMALNPRQNTFAQLR